MRTFASFSVEDNCCMVMLGEFWVPAKTMGTIDMVAAIAMETPNRRDDFISPFLPFNFAFSSVSYARTASV